MSEDDRVIVAIDPGLVSGVAVISVPNMTEDAVKILSIEQSWDDAVTTVLTELDVRQNAVLVVEAFIITQATLRKSFEPWSLYSIGALEYAMIQRGQKDSLTLQSPAMAKSAVSNELLRALGLWHRGGAGHANDALRHAAAFALSRGWRPPSLKEISSA